MYFLHEILSVLPPLSQLSKKLQKRFFIKSLSTKKVKQICCFSIIFMIINLVGLYVNVCQAYFDIFSLDLKSS
jgi:hypothetical protein